MNTPSPSSKFGLAALVRVRGEAVWGWGTEVVEHVVAIWQIMQALTTLFATLQRMLEMFEAGTLPVEVPRPVTPSAAMPEIAGVLPRPVPERGVAELVGALRRLETVRLRAAVADPAAVTDAAELPMVAEFCTADMFGAVRRRFHVGQCGADGDRRRGFSEVDWGEHSFHDLFVPVTK